MPDVAHSRHIAIDAKGRAFIAGTSLRVSQVVAMHLANGWTAEEIYLNLDKACSLSQLYSALAYYHDNRAEIDAELAGEVAESDRFWKAQGETPLRKRLLGTSSKTP